MVQSTWIEWKTFPRAITIGKMSTPSGSSPSVGPSTALIAALRRLLKPLVRLLVNSGITYPYLTNLLKSLFVEVAERDFRLSGRNPSDSRINLLTGVHRKDVKRLRAEQHAADDIPANISLGAQLVARWTGIAQYLDDEGQPKPLPRLASDGGPMSFESLVASVNTDIRSRVVLDEWLRLNVAHIDELDRVCLNVNAFVPEKGYDEKAYYFGRNVHDHIAAGAHNLDGARPPFLERSVYYDRLSADSIQELEVLSRKLGMEALQTINRRALELQAADRQREQKRQRMNFGVYFYSEPEEQDPHENK